MLSLSVHQRYYLYRGHADMRKSFDSLSGMVRDHLQKDPLSGDVFVFMNRRRNLSKKPAISPQEVTNGFIEEYNEIRPHQALNYQTPFSYVA